MQFPDALKPFLNSKVMAYLTRPRPRAGIPIYPKTTDPDAARTRENFVFSDDRKMLRAAERVGDKLTAEFPSSHTPDGFCSSDGVPGDFFSTRCMAGFGQDPMPIPLTDNAELIKAAGLDPDIRPADIPWFTELCRLFFGAAVPADARIKKNGTTALPDMEKDDVQYKKLGFIRIVKELPLFLKLFKKDRYLDLLEKFRVLFCFTIFRRGQPDSVYYKDGKWGTKPRLAPTEQEARTGAASNTYADKTVKDRDGRVIQDHFAMRLRDVFALNGLLNYFISAVFGCFRAVYLYRFAATFKTRGAADKAARIALFKYIVGSDVKTMDKLVPRWFVDRLCSELTKYLHDDVVELIRTAWKSPYLFAPDGTNFGEKFNPLFGGDPLTPGFDNHVGLPSGIACNPDIGKLWMVFNYALVFRDCGALSSPSELEAWLAGANPQHGLQDMADDATMMTNDQLVAQRLAVAKSPYCILEQEIPVIFLGDVYCKDGDTKKVFPNPITYVVNNIAREDDVSKMPLHQWAGGQLARETVYSAAPIYRDMSRIQGEILTEELGFNPASLAKRVHIPVSYHTDADTAFILNNDVIHYKVDPEDVTPALLNAHIATVPAADWWDDMRFIFKVKTAPYEAAKGEALDIKLQSKGMYQ